MKNIYDFKIKRINGSDSSLADFKAKVLLIVNVASKCGLTPQYEALEKIYDKYHSQGFEVLGFPANEFEQQEPGTNAEIMEFCTTNYGVQFPMFEKIIVKGAGIHPLYQFLTNEKPTALIADGKDFEKTLEGYGIFRENKKDILWNFEKFLINKQGQVIARFAPDVIPDHSIITSAIEAALKN